MAYGDDFADHNRTLCKCGAHSNLAGSKSDACAYGDGDTLACSHRYTDTNTNKHADAHCYKHADAHGNEYAEAHCYEYAEAHGNEYAKAHGNQHTEANRDADACYCGYGCAEGCEGDRFADGAHLYGV